MEENWREVRRSVKTAGEETVLEGKPPGKTGRGPGEEGEQCRRRGKLFESPFPVVT